MYRNVKDKVLVEQKMVGFIIGSGGKTIKILQQQSGAQIKMLKKNNGENYAVLTGLKKDVKKAKSLIMDLIHLEFRKNFFKCQYDNLFCTQLAPSYFSLVDLAKFKD